jgi:glucuronate isomerase
MIEAELFALVADSPIVSPHGHVDPWLFADPDATFEDPAAMLVTPDHYLLRMLYSQGIDLADLGVGTVGAETPDVDPRAVWQIFADNFHLFRATPSAQWLRIELATVFGIDTPITSATAGEVYDRLADAISRPEFSPRNLHDRLNIEVLCTTDSATDPLEAHRLIGESGWSGRILPTFRPDELFAIDQPGWPSHIDALAERSGIAVDCYADFIAAIENRRWFFATMGAVATDHGAATPFTCRLEDADAARLFDLARRGQVDADQARVFTGHMLCEMARMSGEDGLVMQLHAGVRRSHNAELAARFGPNIGGDIPLATEWVDNLKPLLDCHGNNPNLRLIVFSLDESPYSRELAPLAGHYPALVVGPPWWFHDSWNGIARYFDQVMETAGLYNTAGFNDDTRAYPSIPARHQVWRRASARWVADLVTSGRLDESEAPAVMHDLATGLARTAYRLEEPR